MRKLARKFGRLLWRWGCKGVWYVEVTAKCPDCEESQKSNLDLLAVMNEVA